VQTPKPDFTESRSAVLVIKYVQIFGTVRYFVQLELERVLIELLTRDRICIQQMLPTGPIFLFELQIHCYVRSVNLEDSFRYVYVQAEG
jgi:hypothetical protein